MQFIYSVYSLLDPERVLAGHPVALAVLPRPLGMRAPVLPDGLVLERNIPPRLLLRTDATPRGVHQVGLAVLQLA